MLLHHQQLQRHPVRPLGAGFSLLDSRFIVVGVAREDRLAHLRFLPNALRRRRGRPNTPNRVLKASASAPFQSWGAGSVLNRPTIAKGPGSSLGPLLCPFPEGNGGLPVDYDPPDKVLAGLARGLLPLSVLCQPVDQQQA
jgi:hypothetical protein